MRTTNLHKVLHEPSIYKGMILLAIPIFLNNLMKSLHDMVDTIFIARMDGYSASQIDGALTALNIYFPVNFLFLSFGIGLSIATVSIVSQYVGAKEELLAKKYASQLLSVGLIIGLVVLFVMVLVSDLVFDFHLIAYVMGARGDALEFAGDYFLFRAFDLPFVFVFLVYQAIRQAQGETLKPVLLNISAIVINMILTWLFVAIFKMGVSGAAIATVLANVIITPFLIMDLKASKKHMTIALKDMSLQRDTVEQVIHFALPASIAQSMTAIGFIIIQTLILSYGVEVSAGFSIANRITMLLLNPVVAISSVLASYVGINIGHQQQKRAEQSYVVARNISVFMMLIGIMIVIPFRSEFVALILGTSNSASYFIAVEYVFWLLLTQPFMAMFQTYVGLYNGAGMPRYTLLISLIRLWGMRIPMILLYPLIFINGSYEGIWYAMIVSNLLIIPIGYVLKGKLDYQMKVSMHA
jgi:putative MATE family efflux protein